MADRPPHSRADIPTRPSVTPFAGVAAALLALVVAPAASAAVLTGSLNTAPTGPINLTLEGPTDWAVWNYTANPISTTTKTIASSNRKAGVTPVISSATTLLGNPRGTTSSAPIIGYSYTDGVSPTSITNTAQGIFFDSTLQNANAGLTFTIAGGPAGVPQVAKLYLTGFAATPTLTVSLPGAPDYSNSGVTYPSAVRPVSVYTINFTPDNTGDLLTVRYVTGPNSGPNGNVDLQAVAVSPIPEPTALAALGLAGAALAARRRKR